MPIPFAKKKPHIQSSIKRHKYYANSICQKNSHTQSSIKRHEYYATSICQKNYTPIVNIAYVQPLSSWPKIIIIDISQKLNSQQAFRTFQA